MKKAILISIFSIFTLFTSITLYSQIDSTDYREIDSIIYLEKDTTLILKKNTVFAEIGGNGFVYSINYDRLFNISNKFKISARIGIHYTNKFPLPYNRTFCIPTEISGLYSFFRSKHFIELGSGLSYMNSYDTYTGNTVDFIILAFRVGYRFQKPEGGLMVKIGFVPIYDWIVVNPDPSMKHHVWFLSGGLGIGYTF